MRDERETPLTRERLIRVAIGDIAPSPHQTRVFETTDAEEMAALEELATSIRENGLQQPPRVRANPDSSPPWLLVYGERRLRACRDVLGWTEIPVLLDEEMGDERAATVTVVENLQRRDLQPMEEARGIAQLRAAGLSTKKIAARLGRREEWVRERLRLCDLPPVVQDLYRRSARLTLGQMLTLHEYTHGGKDNRGFPALITQLAEDMARGINAEGYLGTLAASHGGLVVRITHWSPADDGRWGGHYFDTKAVCTGCPWAAYRPSYSGWEGFCLLPEHYEELRAKGQEKYERAQAERERKRREDPAYAAAEMDQAIRSMTEHKTAAQKGQETKRRHQAQKAAYYPTVQAIARAIDMIPSVDGVDVAVLCAYTLTTSHIASSAWEQVTKRHGLKDFPRPEPTPTRRQIERLRLLDPVLLVRVTLEMLLVTQAERARDYDPGHTPADPVLVLYVPALNQEKDGAA